MILQWQRKRVVLVSLLEPKNLGFSLIKLEKYYLERFLRFVAPEEYYLHAKKLCYKHDNLTLTCLLLHRTKL